MKPILKWTGGKYDECKEFKHLIPGFKRYYEPFFGGGAVFFALQLTSPCYLNDASTDLMQFYQQSTNPRFQRELWKYVEAWEQSGRLAQSVAKQLASRVEQYVTKKESDVQIRAAINKTLSHITYDTYRPLFEASLILDQQRYIKHLSRSLNDKCRRLRKISRPQFAAHNNTVMQQIETAVQAAFYIHIRWIHNRYAKNKNKY